MYRKTIKGFYFQCFNDQCFIMARNELEYNFFRQPYVLACIAEELAEQKISFKDLLIYDFTSNQDLSYFDYFDLVSYHTYV